MDCLEINSLSQWTLKKKSLNFIFPTKYVVPKSLKFSHWPSKLKKNMWKWLCLEIRIVKRILADPPKATPPSNKGLIRPY